MGDILNDLEALTAVMAAEQPDEAARLGRRARRKIAELRETLAEMKDRKSWKSVESVPRDQFVLGYGAKRTGDLTSLNVCQFDGRKWKTSDGRVINPPEYWQLVTVPKARTAVTQTPDGSSSA